MEREQPARSAGESEVRSNAAFLQQPLSSVEYQNRKMIRLNAENDPRPPEQREYDRRELLRLRQEMEGGSLLDAIGPHIDKLDRKVSLGQLGQAIVPRGSVTDVDSNIFATPAAYSYADGLGANGTIIRHNQTNSEYYRAGGFTSKHFLSDAYNWPRFELEGLDLSAWNGIFVTPEIGMPYPRCTFVTTQGVIVFGLEMSHSGFTFKVLPKQGYFPSWVGEVSWEVDIVQTPNSGDGFVAQISPFQLDSWSMNTSSEAWQSMQSDRESHRKIHDEVFRDVLGFLYFRATRRIEVQPQRGPVNTDVPAAKEGDIYRVVKVDLRNQQNTSTPQGGTHASPREHEREAHWRTYPSGKRVRVRSTIVNKGVSKGTVKKHYEMKEKE